MFAALPGAAPGCSSIPRSSEDKFNLSGTTHCTLPISLRPAPVQISDGAGGGGSLGMMTGRVFGKMTGGGDPGFERTLRFGLLDHLIGTGEDRGRDGAITHQAARLDNFALRGNEWKT